jgi:hypothetical protein
VSPVSSQVPEDAVSTEPTRRSPVTSGPVTSSGRSSTVTPVAVDVPSAYPAREAVTVTVRSLPLSARTTGYVAAVAPVMATPSRFHW